MSSESEDLEPLDDLLNQLNNCASLKSFLVHYRSEAQKAITALDQLGNECDKRFQRNTGSPSEQSVTEQLKRIEPVAAAALDHFLLHNTLDISDRRKRNIARPLKALLHPRPGAQAAWIRPHCLIACFGLKGATSQTLLPGLEALSQLPQPFEEIYQALLRARSGARWHGPRRRQVQYRDPRRWDRRDLHAVLSQFPRVSQAREQSDEQQVHLEGQHSQEGQEGEGEQEDRGQQEQQEDETRRRNEEEWARSDERGRSEERARSDERAEQDQESQISDALVQHNQIQDNQPALSDDGSAFQLELDEPGYTAEPTPEQARRADRGQHLFSDSEIPRIDFPTPHSPDINDYEVGSSDASLLHSSQNPLPLTRSITDSSFDTSLLHSPQNVLLLARSVTLREPRKRFSGFSDFGTARVNPHLAAPATHLALAYTDACSIADMSKRSAESTLESGHKKPCFAASGSSDLVEQLLDIQQARSSVKLLASATPQLDAFTVYTTLRLMNPSPEVCYVVQPEFMCPENLTAAGHCLIDDDRTLVLLPVQLQPSKYWTLSLIDLDEQQYEIFDPRRDPETFEQCRVATEAFANIVEWRGEPLPEAGWSTRTSPSALCQSAHEDTSTGEYCIAAALEHFCSPAQLWTTINPQFWREALRVAFESLSDFHTSEIQVGKDLENAQDSISKLASFEAAGEMARKYELLQADNSAQTDLKNLVDVLRQKAETIKGTSPDFALLGQKLKDLEAQQATYALHRTQPERAKVAAILKQYIDRDAEELSKLVLTAQTSLFVMALESYARTVEKREQTRARQCERMRNDLLVFLTTATSKLVADGRVEGC